MKTFLFLSAALSGTVIFSACSHTLAPASRYQETPVQVDGKINDWKLPLQYSNQQYTLQYSVTNDNQNVYVCVLTRDNATQMRILKAGMTVYFDPKGEKNKKISISFPIRKPSDPNDYKNGNPMRNVDVKATKDQLLLQSDYYNISNFMNIENGQFALNDKHPAIQVAINLNDDSTLVYEAVIPIKTILGVDLNPKIAAKNFSVGIVVSALSGQNRNGNGGYPRSSYGGGGMRGMHMGGMGMGRRNYGSSNNASAKEDESWYQFHFSTKKS